MYKFKTLAFILILALSQSCRLQDEDDLSLLQGASSGYRSCSFSLVETIHIGSTNPKHDFLSHSSVINGIRENGVKTIKQITTSTCPDYPDGSLQKKYKYVSRVGNLLLTSQANLYKSGTDVLSFFIMSNKIDNWSSLTCDFSGRQTEKKLISALFDDINGLIMMTYSYKISDNGCAAFDNTPYLSPSKLEGVWDYGCSDGMRVELSFFESSLTKLTSYFTDTSCAGNPYIKINENGTFNANGFSLSSQNELVGRLNLSYQEFLITLNGPYSFDFNHYNQIKVCDLNIWQEATPINVTNKKCQLGDISPKVNYQNFTYYQRERYDIFKISGNNLFLGDATTGNKIKEDQRPTELNLLLPIIKNSMRTIRPAWAL